MSLADACQRREAYLLYGAEEDDGYLDDRKAVAMYDGNLHEQDLVRRLLSKGHQVWNYGSGQKTSQLTSQGLFFRGRPDLFLERDSTHYGLEIKAFKDIAFEKLTQNSEEIEPGIFRILDPKVLTIRPFPVMGQIQLYLHSSAAEELQVEEWILIVKNKNTSELAECVIPKMPEILDEVVGRWVGFWGYIGADRLPERPFSNDSLECKLCAFYKRCWDNLAMIPNTSTVVENPELSEDWRKGKALSDYGEMLTERARVGIIALAESVGARRLEIDGLKTVIKNDHRRGFDTDYTKLLLDTLRMEGQITEAQYTDCFTTHFHMEVRVRDTRPPVS